VSREALAISKLFSIQDKDGTDVPFHLTPAQTFLDRMDNPTSRVRLLIAKARQKGFSSVILAKFTIRCLGKSGTKAVVISHEADATQRLLDRSQYYLKHMKGPKPQTGRNSRSELSFPLRDSTYFIGTAGSRAFGRGDTITDLHCSEYAWWDVAERHVTGLFQAVPRSGRIYIESTGNGRHNDFYYMWKHADAMNYTRAFYAWWMDDEYTLKLPPHIKSWKPDLPKYNAYLREMQAQHKLRDDQMYWYEDKFKEMRENQHDMQQEYPSEPEECFQATGGQLFNNIVLSEGSWEQTQFEGYYVYQLAGHPQAGMHYVVGGDPSGGTGRDDAAMVVIYVETAEQVMELFNNRIAPIAFGELLCKAGKLYNTAFITCESNNHGAAVIPYLKDNYPREQLYKQKLGTKATQPKYGWYNSDTSKHALIGNMQEWLDEVKWYGKQTIGEFESFEETEKGKMEGDSDNIVIASGLAMLGYKKLEHLRQAYITPKVIESPKAKPNYLVFTLDEVLDNIGRRHGFYSSSQVGSGYPHNYNN
jgi:hypothetical protein